MSTHTKVSVKTKTSTRLVSLDEFILQARVGVCVDVCVGMCADMGAGMCIGTHP